MFWVLALRQSDWRSSGLYVGLYADNSYTIGGSLVGIWWQENKTKLVEWKALIDTMRIKSADLEHKFLFLCFMAFQTA